MTLAQQLAEEERFGFIKQIADKLYQGMQKVYDTKEKEKRRWIWELIQNAKDTKNQFGQVIVKISVDEKGLLFEHNDDPFSIKNLVGLLQQVSDKTNESQNDNDEEADEQTGKFGTGFITTHMLSKVITVEGLLDCGDTYKQFKFELDRDAETSMELVDKVKILLKKKDELSDDTIYPPRLKSSYLRGPESFETKFYYPLSKDTVKYAREGIDDLENGGVYSLLFNERIKKFLVVDHLSKQNYSVERGKSAEVEDIPIFQVNIDTSTPQKVTLAYIYDNTTLTYIVTQVTLSSDLQIESIVELNDNVPTLFKEFPLIGTEGWLFAFVINSNNFQPTEPRDGLRLHQEKGTINKEVKQNRDQLLTASKLAAKFIASLSKLKTKPKNLHFLVESGIPKKEQQTDVIEYLLEVQSEFRTTVKFLEIVLTDDGYKTINTCRFPVLSRRINHGPEANLTFYKLCLPLFKTVLPIEDDYPSWHKIISNGYETWGTELIIALEDFLKMISTRNLQDLQCGRDEKAVFEWLNELYLFIDDNKFIDSYRNYALIPNQKGKLIIASEAIKDEEKNIPELLKNISEAFDLKYRDRLVDDRIECKEVTAILTISKIYQELNPVIAKNLMKPEAGKPEHISAVFSLCNIATTASVEDKIPLDEERRLNLVNHLSALFAQWKSPPSHLPPLKDFNFESGLKVSIRYCLYQVSTYKNLAALNLKLAFADFDKVVLWIDKLIKLVSVHPELKVLLDEYAIFPNQKDVLCNRKSLQADIDLIDEELKNIHEELHPTANIRSVLLRDGIDTCSVERKYTLPNIAGEINTTMQANESKLSETGYRNTALKMVNWISQEKNRTKAIHFSWIDTNKANIVLKSLDAHREPIFQILQSNKDFKKLAEIAKSPNFDAIVDLANSTPFQLHQIKQIIDLANISGGVEKLKEYVEDKVEEYNDAEFRRAIGAAVEQLFRNAFSEVSPLFRIDREPFGQDFILRFPGLDYKVEIKSRAIGKGFVHMSVRQGSEAAKTPDDYCLVVLERIPYSGTPTLEYFKDKARFIMDIGYKLKNRVGVVTKINELISQDRQVENNIELDDLIYRYRIGKKVWDDSTAPYFNGFVEKIKERLSLLTAG